MRRCANTRCKSGAEQPNSADAPRLRMAEADNALDALREFLRGSEQPIQLPAQRQIQPPGAAPSSTSRSAKIKQRATQIHQGQRRRVQVQPVAEAHYLGTGTCLICHTSQADSFGKTLMGRIGKTQTGKFDCENCHGPASAHVKAGGCAACHGEDGQQEARNTNPRRAGPAISRPDDEGLHFRPAQARPS